MSISLYSTLNPAYLLIPFSNFNSTSGFFTTTFVPSLVTCVFDFSTNAGSLTAVGAIVVSTVVSGAAVVSGATVVSATVVSVAVVDVTSSADTAEFNESANNAT